jgi:hypothetical protein
MKALATLASTGKLARGWGWKTEQPLLIGPSGKSTDVFGYSEIRLDTSGKSVIYELPRSLAGDLMMSEPISELVEISKLNGDFKRNYGKLLGGFLYLRSVGAARGRSYLLGGLLFAIFSFAITWLQKHGFSWLL